VSAVKFVGSTNGGKKVAKWAGQYLKKGSFELGGSDPFIVLADADLDLAVEKAVMGRLHNTG
jgi:acyl-CoA reductase-like NAD-dependent aldehyde dehydrogenase